MKNSNLWQKGCISHTQTEKEDDKQMGLKANVCTARTTRVGLYGQSYNEYRWCYGSPCEESVEAMLEEAVKDPLENG